uniref:Retrotransposon gag domain-containing protein n=1 Tax=Caenorhabditis japonica TaxID=281687 RepID=A0A8R1ILE4_CAEJA
MMHSPTINVGGRKRKPVGRAQVGARKSSEAFGKPGAVEKKGREGENWCEKVESWYAEAEKLKERKGASSWENRSDTRTNTSRRSEVKDMMDGMRRMMRAQALPEPGVFDGEGDFGEFKRAFLLKYNNVTEGPEEMVAILEDKFLKGPAKTLFKTLPNRHNRSIKSLFEEFEQKLRKRQGDSRTKALNEFENLRKSPNQKMWEYLIDVEKWSRKAYPGVDEGNLSQMRTTKLMMAVKDNENLHNLLIMKRLDYSIEKQYENLKNVVLQQEQEKRQSLKKVRSESKSLRDTLFC